MRRLLYGAWVAVMITAGVVVAVMGERTPARAAAEPELFQIQKVADGVYAALAKPRTPINCNAVVVVYDDGALVVDTHSRPSSANALIAQIRTITDKPIRYAVNTHFHWDHAQGNHAYPVAFPKQVTIVASEATRENLRTLGAGRVKDQLASTPGQITALEAQLAKATDAATQARLRDELAQQKDYLQELKSLEITLPDLTFDKSLILHRGDRRIVLLFLGRGHTSGDVVVWLPKERVIATGDLLHGWMPYMGDSYPSEWVATLDALDKLEFDQIIGGHGTVKPRSHLRFFRDYLADLIAAVQAAKGRGETLEQARVSVAAALKPKYDAGMNGEFAGSVGANIDKVYQDLEAKKYLMRTTLGVLFTLALSALTAASPQTPPAVGGAAGPGLLVFIGTYTSPASQGIYAARLNPATGELSKPVLAAVARNATFLAASADGRFLYSVNEVDTLDGKPGGGLSAYAVDPKAGTLKFLNQQSSIGGGPCHVSVVGHWAFVANYGGGSVAACPIKADGSLDAPSSFVQHKGSSVNARRQAGPHAHAVTPDATGRFLYVPDLGMDQVRLYKIDASAPLTPGDPPFTAITPGTGPRHITLSKDGHFAYVIGEMTCTITAFTRVPETGALTSIQTISTLPEGQAVEQGFSTAEVLLHPSGRFLVGSNRGHDSLAVYSVDRATGKLTLVQHVPTGGKAPRAFVFDPTGGFLVAGNQDSDSIAVFKVDAATGKLTNTGHTASVGKPVTFEFVR